MISMLDSGITYPINTLGGHKGRQGVSAEIR